MDNREKQYVEWESGRCDMGEEEDILSRGDGGGVAFIDRPKQVGV